MLKSCTFIERIELQHLNKRYTVNQYIFALCSKLNYLCFLANDYQADVMLLTPIDTKPDTTRLCYYQKRKTFNQGQFFFSFASTSVDLGIILSPDLYKIKSSLNVFQTTLISELSKAHYQKLVSAIELYGMSVTFIPFDGLAEFIIVEERHELREDYYAFIHSLQELVLIPFRKLTSSNKKK